MDLRQRSIVPFVYFIRRLRSDRRQQHLGREPGLQRLYGFWWVYDGTVTLQRGAESWDLRPGAIGLSQPGMGAVLRPRARATYAAFSLLPRQRLVRDDQAITIEVAEAAEPPWAELFGIDLPVVLLAEGSRELRLLLDEAAMTYWRGPLQRTAVGLRLAAWLCAFAARLSKEGRPPMDSLVERCDELIALRARDPITIADLATELGVSQAHLTRRYSALRSCGPGQALRRERIAQAKELLINENDPVGTLAMRVGYRDASSFIRSFRDLVGQTPEAWRRRWSRA